MRGVNAGNIKVLDICGNIFYTYFRLCNS